MQTALVCGLGALEHNAASKTTANRAISARFAVVLRLITTLFFPSGPSREILSAAGRLLAAFFRGKNQTVLQKRTFSLFSDITILKKPHENRAAKKFRPAKPGSSYSLSNKYNFNICAVSWPCTSCIKANGKSHAVLSPDIII